VSVVRLEITMLDDDAALALVNKLSREYVDPGARNGWAGAAVTILADARVTRDRVILAAAAYFLPEDP
jgi:hypothetical protein